MIQDAWKNFELSGKVSDYLNYRQSTGLSSVKKAADEGLVTAERGISGYGTEHSSDRHGIKYNADWRV